MVRRISIRDALLSVDILEECASLGASPQCWQQCLVDRLTTSLGGAVVILAVSGADAGGRVEIGESQVTSGVGMALRDTFDQFCRDGAFAMLPEFRRIMSVLARHGRISYRQDQLVGRRAYLRSEMHQSYLRQHSVEDHVAAVRVLADGRCLGVSVHRARGERRFSQRDEDLMCLLVDLVRARIGTVPSGCRTFPSAPALSPRLIEALERVLGGASEKEMARAMSLSATTLHQYVQTLYRAHAVHSRSELMALYLNRHTGGLALASAAQRGAAH